MKGLSSRTRAILKQMDPLTLVALKILPPSLVIANENAYTNDDIATEDIDLGWRKTGRGFDEWSKKTNTQLVKHQVSPKFTTFVLKEDDFFGKYTCMDSLTNKGMSSTFLFPMQDRTVTIESEEVAKQVARDLDLVEGKALPVSYNSDFDMLTDESFSRIFFFSLGAPLVAKQKPNDPAVRQDLGPFVVDMPMQDFKVRKNFRPYGARVHFGADQIVTAIFDYTKKTLYKPGEVGWDAAKLLAKVSAFVLVTAREHLIWSHLVLSNTITRESVLVLPPSHTLRRLLTVFTFRATEVNLSAFGTLVPETAILHRAVALEYDSMEAVFDMSYEQCRIYQPFPDHELAPEIEQLSNEGKFPYISQGRAYWKLVQKFVSSWIDSSGDAVEDHQAMMFYNNVRKQSAGQAYELPEYKSKDDMINLITQTIFTVTAYHELVGGVVDYVKYPSRNGFRLIEGETEIDTQSWLLTALIGASTAIRMPQLARPFDKFFGAGGAPAWERDVWDSFTSDLEGQSKKVQAADADRSVEFKYFDPARFECSVSV